LELRFSKQIIGFLLLTIMLVKMCIVPIIYLDYQLRKDFIIATLCENRNRPQLHCDGKCYLAKKIEDAKKQEQRQAANDFLTKMLSAQTPLSDLSSGNFLNNAPAVAPAKTVGFDYSSSLNGRNLVLDFFHPPLC
jgi:hypothetical protein